MIAVDGINRSGNGTGSGNSSSVNGGDKAGVGAVATSVNLMLPKPDEIFSLNVHQRVRWIIAETRSLPKSQWNPEGEFAYAGHDQIIDMLRLLLAKYGVNIYQEPLEYKRDVSIGNQHLTTVKYEYEVVSADNPEDSFVRHNWGEAYDDWDKGLNKCSTIAEKMFLLRLFKISTFDDPDGHSGERPTNRAVSQNGNGKGRREPPAPARNECHVCRELITKARRGDKVWELGEVIAASKRQFGKPLCVDCLLKAQSEVKSSDPKTGALAPPSENGAPTSPQSTEKSADPPYPGT
jgi:hypothetical protein